MEIASHHRSVINEPPPHQMVSHHNLLIVVIVICVPVSSGTAKIAVVHGQVHLIATRVMRHAHSITYVHIVVVVISVSAEMDPSSVNVLASQTASDIHNRAGGHISADANV